MKCHGASSPPDNVPPTLHDAPAGTVMIGNRLIQLEKTELSSL
ncbi:hypothetical protein [Komagataeibacter saccharivorans]|nr:hypothetical protein [Komagataeibacter saccharivorans]